MPTENLPLNVARHLVGHDIVVDDETVGHLSDGTQVVRLTTLVGEPPQELSTRIHIDPSGDGLEDARRGIQLAAWMFEHQRNNI